MNGISEKLSKAVFAALVAASVVVLPPATVISPSMAFADDQPGLNYNPSADARGDMFANGALGKYESLYDKTASPQFLLVADMMQAMAAVTTSDFVRGIFWEISLQSTAIATIQTKCQEMKATLDAINTKSGNISENTSDALTLLNTNNTRLQNIKNTLDTISSSSTTSNTHLVNISTQLSSISSVLVAMASSDTVVLGSTSYYTPRYYIR